jgi:acyl dehydratase
MHLERVLNKTFPVLRYQAVPRDCILYALGIGYGSDPTNPRHLTYTYERGVKVFPAMVNVIAHPGGWVQEPELGVDWVRLLHGEQSFTMHAPLESNAMYEGRYKVKGVVDKGKMALVYAEKELRDANTGALISTVTSTYVLRGDGGCGSTMTEPPRAAAIPETPPDATCSIETSARAALVYRLSGDYNAIHADPELARKAGFERPILHGLCTLAVVTRAILDTYGEGMPDVLADLSLRFSAPVYPGETLITEMWRSGSRVQFRAKVAERNLVVLDAGVATLR